MKQNNVIKINENRPHINEKTILLRNMSQTLLEVVRQHGAHTTLQVLQGMVQEAQRQVRDENKQPNGPKRAIGGTK